MKRLLLAVLYLCICSCAMSQAYNNEWIDFSKTYYKFKLGTTGVTRISQSVLAGAGLSEADAGSFQLWRNGKQVPIYTSVISGPLPSNGFIEFYGQQNDGYPDKPLYFHSSYFLNGTYSLFTDTATYFLTVAPGGSNLRVADAPNNVASNLLAPEPYFMCRNGSYFKNVQGVGPFLDVDGAYIETSAFDAGAFWFDGAGYFPGSPFTNTFNGYSVYAAGPPSTVRVGFANLVFNDTRDMRLSYGSSQVLKDTVTNNTQACVLSGQVPTNQLAAGNFGFTLSNNNTTDPNDEFTVSFIDLTYPSTFTFGNASNSCFSMPASDTGNYLQVSSFAYGSVAPVLYDITNGLRITGDISVPGMVKWVLPPSMTARTLILMSEDPSVLSQVTALQSKQFVNFSVAANQGNFLIISNPILYNDGQGNNNVEAYRQYRISSTGGGFNAKTMDINELVDQFAFGIKQDPLSVKNFLRYARNVYPVKPQYAFLIGKAVNYQGIRQEESLPVLYKLAMVPTFGYPGSDMMLGTDSTQFGLGNATALGRLSAINGTEVGVYLQKVKEYEQVQAQYTGTIAGDSWKKNVIHVIGADAQTGDIIQADLANYAITISDTFYGGQVNTFRKNSTANVQDVSGTVITNLFSAGVGLVNYFGHSSATVLGYNLGDPSQFNMKGKYPFFIANGCDAGDMFEPDSTRLTPEGYTVTEKFILAPENGGIGYLAASSIGVVNYLDTYNTHLYNGMSQTYYGLPMGQQMIHVTHDLGNSSFEQDFFGRCCLEEMSLDGDPSISLYHFALPDYAIEDPQVLISPSIISVANSNFTVKARFYNLGRAVTDSILVTIKWQLPDGTTTFLYNQKRLGADFADSIMLTVPINPTKDKGNNTLIVTLNADGKVSELSMSNNSVSKQFYIYDQQVSPAYPYNYSIVSKSPITFYASSADPLDSVRNYIFEADTTALFNSPAMVKQVTSFKGGLLSFSPALSLRDSVVYYWRVAILPPTGNPTNWSLSSFVYIPGSPSGWNQSHYFQWGNDTYNSMELDSDRVFRFSTISHALQVSSQLYPFGGNSINTTILDGVDINSTDCGNTLGTMAFLLVNQAHDQPLSDTTLPNGNGQYGSVGGCATVPLFHFQVTTVPGRKAAMDFLDSIPGGTIVGLWNFMYIPDTSQFIGAWKADTALYGSGHSLYNSLKSIGFSSIDSLYHFVPVLYLARKEINGTWTVFSQQGGATQTDLLNASVNFNSMLQQGTIASTYVGPAKSWQEINWKGNWDATSDTVQMMVYGVKKDSSENLLYTSNAFLKDTTLAFIPAATYPQLHLKLMSKDSVHLTPYQLQRWMVKYQEVPEGAIAPNHFFTCPDTLLAGQPLDFGVGFNNISNANFDSLKLLLTVTDNQNVLHTYTLPRTKPLVSGDSVHIMDTIPTQNLTGKNTLYLFVNPNNDQPEQYLYNNFLYKTFYVKANQYQPTLDVTFDGVHILNQDIVSAKPQVLIRLQDASPYLGLTDSSVISIQVRFPDGSLHTYVTGTDSAKFVPANLSTGKNIASVLLTPTLIEDGNYELIVNGQDESGNPAGRLSYDVTFRVINTPMISNVFNYPNPFTTSTAFVFTITGSEIPQMIRIEILTITGKVVQEINEAQLGPLHIGTNITQYKWNGTDQFGQKVGNGIYLYRVITNLNGKSLGKFTDQGDNTNKYFKSGYGKMYLMR